MRRLLHLGPNILQIGLSLRLGPNVIADMTFITLVPSTSVHYKYLIRITILPLSLCLTYLRILANFSKNHNTRI